MSHNNLPGAYIKNFPDRELAGRVLNTLNKYAEIGLPDNISTDCSDGEVLTAEILSLIKRSSAWHG